jgi:hypothetical protein
MKKGGDREGKGGMVKQKKKKTAIHTEFVSLR